jgi:hypothetical protein
VLLDWTVDYYTRKKAYNEGKYHEYSSEIVMV